HRPAGAGARGLVPAAGFGSRSGARSTPFRGRRDEIRLTNLAKRSPSPALTPSAPTSMPHISSGRPTRPPIPEPPSNSLLFHDHPGDARRPRRPGSPSLTREQVLADKQDRKRDEQHQRR